MNGVINYGRIGIVGQKVPRSVAWFRLGFCHFGSSRADAPQIVSNPHLAETSKMSECIRWKPKERRALTDKKRLAKRPRKAKDTNAHFDNTCCFRAHGRLRWPNTTETSYCIPMLSSDQVPSRMPSQTILSYGVKLGTGWSSHATYAVDWQHLTHIRVPH